MYVETRTSQHITHSQVHITAVSSFLYIYLKDVIKFSTFQPTVPGKCLQTISPSEYKRRLLWSHPGSCNQLRNDEIQMSGQKWSWQSTKGKSTTTSSCLRRALQQIFQIFPQYSF